MNWWGWNPRHRAYSSGARRLYAIGDVHGCHELLRDLLRRIDQDRAGRPTADTCLILLGDFIDRGPGSREVCDLLHGLSETGQAICLRGNHEQSMLDALDGDQRALGFWLDYGGDATLRSWGIPDWLIEEADYGAAAAERLIGAFREAIAPEVVQWLRGLPAFHVQDDYLFVHAGIRPRVPLDEQQESDLLWIRQPFLQSRARHPWRVIHGHSEVDEVQYRPNRIGIDTAAYRSGILTALALEGEECWTLQTSAA